jgi:alkylmercury lyase
MTSDRMSTAVRLLAKGAPVTMVNLAVAAGVDITDLTDAPRGQDIEYDEHHRIVGWGLTLIPTPHSFVVDGRQLYTWCAADTLMFPAIIGRRAQVESRCPTTDTVIRLTVDPECGVTELSPATAVISIPAPDELDVCRVRSSCCNPGRFFATAEAAADWLVQYPTGTVMPVADAIPHVQPIADRLFGISARLNVAECGVVARLFAACVT